MSGRSPVSNIVNGQFSLILIILVTILCWSVTIISKTDGIYPGEVNAGLLYNLLYRFITPEILIIVNYALVLFIGLLLLWLNRRFSLIRTKTLLPFLFYMLFLTIDSTAFFSFEGNINTFFLLIIVFYFFKSYQSEKFIEQAFNIGLLLSLGSLFSGQMLFFIPMIWIGLACMQVLSAKSFFASLVGILIPYWLVFCWFLYQKNLVGFAEPFYHLIQIKPLSVLDFNTSDWLRICFSGVITICGIVNFRMNSFKDKIKTRVYFYLLIALIVYVFLLLAFGILPMSEYIGIYYFSVSLFAAHFFATVNTRMSTIFFYLFLITFLGLLFFEF